VAFENTSQLQRALDGTNFGLSLIFPIGNVVRAVLVGLNVYIVNCRNGNFVSSPRSIYAYGGPILYLCLQICFLFWLLLWLEGNHAIYFPRLYKSHVDEEDEVQTVIQEVIDEKNRVESSDSDLLRVLHLVKTFGSNRAVDDVSFGLSPGEILALLGPNGAGKSTIINIIRGELQADQGSVLLQGVDMAQHARMGRRHLGCKLSLSLQTRNSIDLVRLPSI
jgi:ATP-binding cassette subfamily A (ABC1) protein 3